MAPIVQLLNSKVLNRNLKTFPARTPVSPSPLTWHLSHTRPATALPIDPCFLSPEPPAHAVPSTWKAHCPPFLPDPETKPNSTVTPGREAQIRPHAGQRRCSSPAAAASDSPAFIGWASRLVLSRCGLAGNEATSCESAVCRRAGLLTEPASPLIQLLQLPGTQLVLP